MDPQRAQGEWAAEKQKLEASLKFNLAELEEVKEKYEESKKVSQEMNVEMKGLQQAKGEDGEMWARERGVSDFLRPLNRVDMFEGALAADSRSYEQSIDTWRRY